MTARDRLAVMLDRDTLDLIDAEIVRRRMRDGGRYSRASVVREAVINLVQRWHGEDERVRGEGR